MKAIWTARCKSGYQFNGRTCNRSCARGQLLCHECATAEVVKVVAPESLLSKLGQIVASMLQSLRTVRVLAEVR